MRKFFKKTHLLPVTPSNITASFTEQTSPAHNKGVLLLIRFSFFISLFLCGVKFIAWFLTGSLVILSDALESIINVAGAGFAWYSTYLSGKPRDAEHPYGHGKVEFFSIGFEGALVFIAGLYIFYEGFIRLTHPQPVQQVSVGLILTGATGMINLIVGLTLLLKGKAFNSITLQGNGRHLLSDSYTSMGVLVAMGLLLLTGENWIDPVASLVAGAVILITGFRLVRRSVAGLMDEADPEVVETIIHCLQQQRYNNWIDVHNLRVQRYGSSYHVDCHLTLPFYFTLQQVHDEVSLLDRSLNAAFPSGDIEFFIHTDPCIPASCQHCLLADCKERQQPFIERLEWRSDNLLPNKKHGVEMPQ